MLDFDLISFKDSLEYYSYIMERYFRRQPPVPSHIYLSGEAAEDSNVRRLVAEKCSFPAIINVLANDENDLVRETARQNKFWKLVGRYQDILGFGRKERKSFAHNEGRPNIIVLLMFEDDPEIVEEILHNPTISLKMLVLYMQLLKKRGSGRKDFELQEIAKKILLERREQIIKISAVYKAAEKITQTENISVLLGHLADQDRTVRRAIENILVRQDAVVIKQFVNYSLEEEKFESSLSHFSVLSWLLMFIKKRDDFRQTSLSALKFHEKSDKTQRFLSIAEFFNNLLSKKRNALVKASASDLTNFNNIILLSLCHTENDKELLHLAQSILSVEDILSLVNEPSTPRHAFRRVLNILENHSDERIVEHVRESHLQESSRLRDSLKELELTVQAYFDIIFQSLGYNKINEYINVVRSITTTQNQLQKFEALILQKMGKDYDGLSDYLNEVQHIMRNKANVIYFDISPRVTRELNYIFTVIDNIFNLKEMGLQSLRPGTPEDVEFQVSARARLIWQSAISAYLGRIKDLSEMIRKKIVRAAAETVSSEELEIEMTQAGNDIEQSYKTKIQCSLKITCRVCSRRGCAAERFLRETHFFIKEFLENFASEEDEA